MSRLPRIALLGFGLVLALSACSGQTTAPNSASGESSSAQSKVPSDVAEQSTGVPTTGTPAGTPMALDAKAACQAFNDGFVEYRDGVKDAANKNWLLLGAKMIDIAGRSPENVSGPLTKLSDLAFARADANGGSVPKDKETAVSDSVLQTSSACTAAGVTLTL